MSRQSLMYFYAQITLSNSPLFSLSLFTLALIYEFVTPPESCCLSVQACMCRRKLLLLGLCARGNNQDTDMSVEGTSTSTQDCMHVESETDISGYNDRSTQTHIYQAP